MRIKIFVITILFLASSTVALSQFIVNFNANKVTGCDSLTVQFTDDTGGNNFLSWLWEFGDNTTDTVKNPVHTYSQTGNYTVKLTVTKTTGTNSKTRTNYINIYDIPVANFSFTDSVFNTSFTILFSSSTAFDTSGYSYKWNFGDNDTGMTSRTIHNYHAAGTYSVFHQVTSNQGCTNDTTKEVIVMSNFLVPNIFTPNGDGVNDEFVIKTSGNAVFTFEVFDRWGNLLYSDIASSIRWDGRSLAGTPLVSGTYFYLLTSKEDEAHSKKAGSFELIR